MTMLMIPGYQSGRTTNNRRGEAEQLMSNLGAVRDGWREAWRFGGR